MRVSIQEAAIPVRSHIARRPTSAHISRYDAATVGSTECSGWLLEFGGSWLPRTQQMCSCYFCVAPLTLLHCFPARMIPVLTVAASCKSHPTIRNALTVPCHAVLCCGMPCCAVPQPQVNIFVRTGKDGGPIEVMTVLSTKLCSASNVHSTPFQLIPLCLLCCAVLPRSPRSAP